MDTTPTQGLDKSSGKSRKGADVINNEQDKAFAEAFRPLTGMDAEQRETLQRRFKLATDAKMECARLDGILAAQQAAVRTAGKPAVAGVEASLLVTRRRFRELRC